MPNNLLLEPMLIEFDVTIRCQKAEWIYILMIYNLSEELKILQFKTHFAFWCLDVLSVGNKKQRFSYTFI